jgi:hypothetical protein
MNWGWICVVMSGLVLVVLLQALANSSSSVAFARPAALAVIRPI